MVKKGKQAAGRFAQRATKQPPERVARKRLHTEAKGRSSNMKRRMEIAKELEKINVEKRKEISLGDIERALKESSNYRKAKMGKRARLGKKEGRKALLTRAQEVLPIIKEAETFATENKQPSSISVDGVNLSGSLALLSILAQANSRK